MHRMNFPSRKDKRKEEAKERQEKRKKLIETVGLAAARVMSFAKWEAKKLKEKVGG